MVKVEIFGMEHCATCTNLKKHVEELLPRIGIEGTVVKITKPVEIMKAGVMQMPGLRINGLMKSTGIIPSDADLTDWLTAAASKDNGGK